MDPAASDPSRIKSLGIGMDVLEILREAGGCTVTEIAETLDVSASTAHRYLKTLYDLEYVIKDGQQYKIGLKFMQFGLQAKNRYDKIEMIEQKVEELATETGERSQFMVAEHGKAVCLCHAMGEKAVQLKLEIGERVPLHAIAPGKAILASWSDHRVNQYITKHGLAELTEQTVSSASELRTELKRIRDAGYSTNQQEYMDQINAVAVPVHFPSGELYGAVGIAGPVHRIDIEHLENGLLNLLRGTASEIQLNLEYSE